MGLFNKFDKTILYKKNSELEYQIEALKKVQAKYPHNSAISKKLMLCELGLKGEKEIEFELKNANIGMYVLHDVNLEFENLKAQIDYIIITPAKVYFVECKNLTGNISVNSKGEFIREWHYKCRTIKEGIYSPLRQAERHIEIFKKIWSNNNKGLLNKIKYNNMDKWYVPLVVMANAKNILNIKYAPKEIKSKIVKSDNLVNLLKKDISNTESNYLWNKEDMKECAFSIMNNYNTEIERDYEQELINWLKESKKIKEKKDYGAELIQPIKVYNVDIDTVLNIRQKLVEFRKEKSKSMNVPAYYIFTNEELDKILKIMPIDIEELQKAKILSPIKLKVHGNEIVDIINDVTN